MSHHHHQKHPNKGNQPPKSKCESCKPESNSWEAGSIQNPKEQRQDWSGEEQWKNRSDQNMQSQNKGQMQEKHGKKQGKNPDQDKWHPKGSR